MNPTFSQLPRAFRCLLSTALPQNQEHQDEPDRALGTARHRYLERVSELHREAPGRGALVLELAREKALEEAAEEHRPFLAAIPLERLELAGVATEVAFSIDVSGPAPRARELGRGINRAYGKPGRDEVVGTVDRLALIEPDGCYVGDYKGRAWSGDVRQDEQLLAGALAASVALGRRWVEVEVIRLIDGEPMISKGRLERFDLDLFYYRLQELVRAVWEARVGIMAGAIPNSATGPWCRWCPSFRYCPAQMALARAALSGEHGMVDVVSGKVEALSPAGAAALYQRAKSVERVLELVQAAVRDYARVHPFPLEDGSGRWYGVPPGSEERQITDGERAADAVESLLGADAAKAARKVTVTFEGLEAAVRAWLKDHPDKAGRGSLAKGTKELVQALKEQGLVRVSNATSVRPYKPRE